MYNSSKLQDKNLSAPCIGCNGSGKIALHDGRRVRCQSCNGTGKYLRIYPLPYK